jgi:aryl-alcohol dehydrogenase-like predicted oxidoreductase
MMYARLMTTRELGRTGLYVSPIGLGCMQIAGRGIVATMFPAPPQTQVDEIIKAALDGGITWFDTAEMYGHGGSERALSNGLVYAGIKPGDVTVATKWAPFGRTAKSIERTIDDRLAALDPFPVDLHQIHMGFGSFSSTRSQLHAMARLAAAHEIGAVGVSNFSARQMEAAHAALAEHDISLATNQVQINLLHRNIESNGVLDTARRLGVTLIAYSPLREGILTGKFHDDRSLFANVPRLRRTVMRMSDKTLDRSAVLIDGLREIAAAHRATISQVALAWVIQNYGDIVVAIPGASKPRHAEEAAGAQKLSLSDEDLRRLSDLSSRVTG